MTLQATDERDAPLATRLAPFPHTQVIVERLLALWPEHRRYLETRFRVIDPDFEGRIDELAELALRVIGDELDVYCAGYRWMCEAYVEEEFHFRRHGQYRLSTFADTLEQVYSNPEIMGKYVRALLMSQIVWDTHARGFDCFRTDFLTRAPAGAKYLEVGPGHGLFLYFASQVEQIADLEAWDISQSSIAETQHALQTLGATRPIAIIEQDVLVAPTRRDEFDMAVISEVLEHLERPDLALQSLQAALKPGGRLYINAPVNSPAPDHIYNWASTDAFKQFVIDQGFEIEQEKLFPVTGATLDRALRKNLAISCVIIARKPL